MSSRGGSDSERRGDLGLFDFAEIAELLIRLAFAIKQRNDFGDIIIDLKK